MLDDSFHVFDTTLRDGAQREGVNLTVADKLAIARLLDEFGVGFIEGGWPGANPKDTEFFRRARTELPLRNARLTAFGSTRRAGTRAADDPQVAALRESGAPVVTLVAKSDARHVERALRTTLAENLAMVADTVAYLREHGQRIFVDCEHFFDGYRYDPEYALSVVRAAAEAGADVVVLCDTNGGMLPADVTAVVAAVRERTGARLGIHAQDDTGCAVANTLAAVDAGVTHVQCTANGYGERVGNANLFSVVGALELKYDRRVLPEGGLREMTRVSQAVAEIVNIAPATHQPYVGVSAFAHKAGLHASAIKVDPDLYQHTDPALVGNDMRMLVSDMAGRASIELKAKELGIDLSGDRALLGRVVDRVKALELRGYSFEAADASLELLLREELGRPVRYFEAESWRVIAERRAAARPEASAPVAGGRLVSAVEGSAVGSAAGGGVRRAGSESPRGSADVSPFLGAPAAALSEATVKLHVKGERVIATAEGNGPVNALDRALRTAMEGVYTALASLELTDYKVRILEGTSGTDAVTRILLTFSDGRGEWTTVGVGENVIDASWTALEQAVTYGLLRQGYPSRV
ncbi:citramalate synthase [Marinitenerispora sediminis]|uniref:Citramalate synthase n=1 Tax=Marinitenerispora sediminis TaxID=1931232 RepID=A0A368T4T0_9ACTN|nr:citramalate synthase [Marinitenerispora sediminis]RCV51262.1 citramalate synthase [Marinitenerispora sediminis]RCV55509.1 citramalate synthase [Marinitenerispora sediminis]RCV58063.1 citramalate synthase [Marinitenerispora sediminis]